MRSRKWWEENMSTITTMWFRGFWTSLAHVVGRYIIPGEYHRVEASINPWILYHVFPAWWAPSTGRKGLPASILTKVYDETDLVMWMCSLHCESFVLVIIPSRLCIPWVVVFKTAADFPERQWCCNVKKLWFPHHHVMILRIRWVGHSHPKIPFDTWRLHRRETGSMAIATPKLANGSHDKRTTNGRCDRHWSFPRGININLQSTDLHNYLPFNSRSHRLLHSTFLHVASGGAKSLTACSQPCVSPVSDKKPGHLWKDEQKSRENIACTRNILIISYVKGANRWKWA